MELVKIILGVLLILFGLVLIALKVAIVLGWLTPPSPERLRRAEEGEGASVWDFLLALLDKAGFLVVVGLILILGGMTLLGTIPWSTIFSPLSNGGGSTS